MGFQLQFIRPGLTWRGANREDASVDALVAHLRRVWDQTTCRWRLECQTVGVKANVTARGGTGVSD